MNAAPHQALETSEIIIERPVTWGSMDSFQHVNNTFYFRYFEDVRIEYFERTGITESMTQRGIGPILASTECRFKFPLRYPDTVWIGTRTFDIGEDRFQMEYTVVSQQHQRIAAVGSGLIVCYDYNNNCKHPIPSAWHEAIQQLKQPKQQP